MFLYATYPLNSVASCFGCGYLYDAQLVNFVVDGTDGTDGTGQNGSSRKTRRKGRAERDGMEGTCSEGREGMEETIQRNKSQSNQALLEHISIHTVLPDSHNENASF